MKLQMHFTTKLWDALLSDQKNPAGDDLGNWAVLCPSCSNWRDTLRLKICGMLRRLLSSDGKEERHYKVKSSSSTRRQENVMLPSHSLWIEGRGKNTRHIKTSVNASDTAFRRNHEPQHANGKQVFFSRLSDRESQVPVVNHTSRKCCFVHRSG